MPDLYPLAQRHIRPIRTWHAHGAVLAASDTSEMRSLLDDPDQFFRQADTVLLKDDKRSTVGLGQLVGKKIVVKRTNARNTLERLRRAVSPSRARRAWLAAARLQQIGIPTANPLAYIERRFGPLRRRSYFVMEALNGVNAREYVNAPEFGQDSAACVAGQIARLMHILHAAGMSHGDNNIRNFMISDGQIYLIDLDAMRSHATWSPLGFRYQQRDIRRLLSNWKRVEPTIGEELAKLLNVEGTCIS